MISPRTISVIPDRDERERFFIELEDELTGYSAQDAPLPGSPLPIAEWNADYRDEGLDWPSTALTMVGRRRLRNYRTLIERALAEDVPGDLVECGAWRGGASILARAVLATHDVADREVVVCDSFEGLPVPTHEADSKNELYKYADLVVSLEQVQANFARFGLTGGVRFVKGWFRDTMPTFTTERIAVLRLDGDMYESTIDPLTYLYDRVSPGGWVIIDDYLLTPCRRAVADFFAGRVMPELVAIDRVGSYFQKP